MANEAECGTYGDRGHIFVEARSPQGRVCGELERPCPDCSEADDDERETDRFERIDYSCESDAHIERRFDFGGES